jgi:hypothetical protein
MAPNQGTIGNFAGRITFTERGCAEVRSNLHEHAPAHPVDRLPKHRALSTKPHFAFIFDGGFAERGSLSTKPHFSLVEGLQGWKAKYSLAR